MRVLIAILALALAAAAPAVAQPLPELTRNLDARRSAEADAARNRAIAQGNETSVLQSRIQTDENLNLLADQRAVAGVPTVPFNPNAPPPKIAMSQMAQIPDAELSASNARAVAASQNRR